MFSPRPAGLLRILHVLWPSLTATACIDPPCASYGRSLSDSPRGVGGQHPQRSHALCRTLMALSHRNGCSLYCSFSGAALFVLILLRGRSLPSF
uniref:Secreted protein n=1 Tax=Knipowitschia caucasica TaxID=637954 RepID=A0AAV2LES4_KNICA